MPSVLPFAFSCWTSSHVVQHVRSKHTKPGMVRRRRKRLQITSTVSVIVKFQLQGPPHLTFYVFRCRTSSPVVQNCQVKTQKPIWIWISIYVHSNHFLHGYLIIILLHLYTIFILCILCPFLTLYYVSRFLHIVFIYFFVVLSAYPSSYLEAIYKTFSELFWVAIW